MSWRGRVRRSGDDDPHDSREIEVVSSRAAPIGPRGPNNETQGTARRLGLFPPRDSAPGATWPSRPAPGWWRPSRLGIDRLQRPIDVLDGAGLALSCVTGAATTLAHRLKVVDFIILLGITGIGGGMLRDILVREIPTVLCGGLYAIPPLVGAGMVVAAYHLGDDTLTFQILGRRPVCDAHRRPRLWDGRPERHRPRAPDASRETPPNFCKQEVTGSIPVGSME